MKKVKMDCKSAREIELISLLLAMGYLMKRQNEKEAWFLSPLRIETIPSFKISKRLNRWYDHGEGTGGNTIDLIIRLKKCSVREALIYLSEGSFSFQKQSTSLKKPEQKIEIVKKQNLQNQALLDYLYSRGITKSIAATYCFELYYRQNGQSYFSIAFSNRSGGMELRNKYFKGCIGSKDFTLIKNNATKVLVFEGFIDFLSYLEIYPRDNILSDYLICNSTSLVNKTYPVLQQYQSIDLYFDNDNAGNKASQDIIENIPYSKMRNEVYQGYNDLNEKLMSVGGVDRRS